jgi:hypothetical protein
MALAPHLRMVVWSRKFWPHLSEKYDGTVNPAEFLQIYSTSILAAGGDEAIMANYFPVALTGTARSWLMNLPEGTLDSWPELCRQFTANFESAYARPGNETDLHAVQQHPGESLRSFIQRFSQVRNTIPRISNASVVVAFRQGVRDEKMLEKLATHNIQDVSTLFSLADKCARASKGRAWHSPAAPASKEVSKPNAGTSAQGVHVMFGVSWDITSWRVVKTLRRKIAAVAPTPKAAPHLKWMETPIGFDASDCPKSMAGAGQLPLLVSPIIANIKLYHVLIDGGAALNLISLARFKKLQIPMGKLQPSRPFSRVDPVSVMPRGCISLPITFGTAENFRTESILFDVAEVSLPFNAILGRPALYRFMVVAHYGYLVLKMPSPGGVLRIRGDHDAGACALEKLQALAVAREAVVEPRD